MSIRLFSLVSAYVVTEGILLVAPAVSRWPLLVGSSLALLVAGEIFLRWTRRPARREPGSRVMIDEARDQALQLLATSKHLVAIPADPSAVSRHAIARLAPELQLFFGKYRSVRSIGGGTVIDVSLILTARHGRGFIRIGTDIEEVEIAVREGDERIFELSHDGGDDDPDESIWHYVIRLETDLRPR